MKKKQKGGILSKIGKIPLSDSYDLKKPANFSSLIQQLLNKEKLSPKQICLTVSPEEALIHQISLPKMKESELNEVIRTEIERIPKFSNKEFDYIYSWSKLDEQRLRVLICALTKDSINAYIQGIQETGIILNRLEISPLNILEALSLHAGKDKKDSVQALLVLEDRLSHVTIFQQNEYKLFFQLTVGKLDLYTQNFELTKSNYASWVEEINRTFKSYQREFRTSAIEKVWIIWDNENTKDIDKLLAKDLETEVIVPQPEDFAIKAELEKEFNPIYFLSLAGAINQIKDIKQKLNFRHFLRQIELKKILNKVKFLVLIYILCISVLLGGFIAYYVVSTNKLLIREKEAGQRIVSLNLETQELRKERDGYINTRNKLLMQAAYVKLLNRISWSEIFARTGAALPDNVSLSLFEASEGGAVKLEGATFSIDTIAELIRKINDVSFLETAQFNFLREREVDEKNEKKKIVEFGIITQLKENLNAEK